LTTKISVNIGIPKPIIISKEIHKNNLESDSNNINFKIAIISIESNNNNNKYIDVTLNNIENNRNKNITEIKINNFL
tara:strand:- start:121 stop:351 length:231 start_codon:yes stop_codon:yes gene_type:complete